MVALCPGVAMPEDAHQRRIDRPEDHRDGKPEHPARAGRPESGGLILDGPDATLGIVHQPVCRGVVDVEEDGEPAGAGDQVVVRDAVPAGDLLHVAEAERAAFSGCGHLLFELVNLREPFLPGIAVPCVSTVEGRKVKVAEQPVNLVPPVPRRWSCPDTGLLSRVTLAEFAAPGSEPAGSVTSPAGFMLPEDGGRHRPPQDGPPRFGCHVLAPHHMNIVISAISYYVCGILYYSPCSRVPPGHGRSPAPSTAGPPVLREGWAEDGYNRPCRRVCRGRRSVMFNIRETSSRD